MRQDDVTPARWSPWVGGDGFACAVTSRLPHLSTLSDAADATRLNDPRALLDAGVDYLCAGFEAKAASSTS